MSHPGTQDCELRSSVQAFTEKLGPWGTLLLRMEVKKTQVSQVTYMITLPTAKGSSNHSHLSNLNDVPGMALALQPL